MKKFLLAMLLSVMLVSMASATIWVSGYTRSDGHYVDSYERSTPSERYDVRCNDKWGW